MDEKHQDSLVLLGEIVSRGLYDKLLNQLGRDFNRANVSLEIKQGTAPEPLVQLLKERIHNLILEDFSSYLNLLYVIDVPESDFDTTGLTSAEEMTEKASYLILRRIWKKVWLKEQLK